MPADVEAFLSILTLALPKGAPLGSIRKGAVTNKAHFQSVSGRDLSPTHASLRSTTSIMIAPFSRACWLDSAPPTLLGRGRGHCHGINYTQSRDQTLVVKFRFNAHHRLEWLDLVLLEPILTEEMFTSGVVDAIP